MHSRDLVGDLSAVIAKAAIPEQVTELKIVLPSLKFMLSLMDLNTSDDSVNIVTEAWSIGLTTSLMVHQNLLPLLSAQKLQQLPVSLTDHKGFRVYTLTQDIIGYGDVALLQNGWLLAENVL